MIKMASSIRSDLPTQSHSTSASVQTVKTSKDFPVACLSRAGPTSEHKTIILDKPEVTVGRSKDNHFCIPDLLVSRKHAIFRFQEGEWTVENVGMNGIMVNHIPLPRNEPCPLNHLDMVEFGAGSKFIYAFRLKSKEGHVGNESESQPPPSKVANRSRLSNGNRNYPSAKDSPEAYQQWMRAKKGLERTLLEESVILDQQLEEQKSRKDQLLFEQKKLQEQSEKEKEQLLSQFAQEKKTLEERVQHGEVEKTELQKEKQALEDRMVDALKQFQDELARKATELEERLERANTEKESLLEQKEFVVQQLTREKQILAESLEEERRLKATAEAELASSREAVRRLEEEKRQLEQKGNEDATRMREVEEALEAKEREIMDYQSANAIGLEMYDAIQYAQVGQVGADGFLYIGEAAGGPAPAAAVDVGAEVEKAVQEERRRQQTALMERMESIYECNICSEVIVTAIGLNCSHAFCQTCINTWKRTKMECPVCRTPITMENRQHLIDNAINDNYSQMPDEIQLKRKDLVNQRQELARIQSAEAAAAAAAAAAQGARSHTHAAEARIRMIDEQLAALGATRARAPPRRVTAAAAIVAAAAPAAPRVPSTAAPASRTHAAAGPQRTATQGRAPAQAAAPVVVADDVVILSSGDEGAEPVHNTRRRPRRQPRQGDSILIVEEQLPESSTIPRARNNKRTICQTCGVIRTSATCDYCQM